MLRFDDIDSSLRTAAGFILILATAPCGHAQPSSLDGPFVRISVIKGRPVSDRIFINGQGPFRFLLDTGAQVNQLGLELAWKLGLRPSFQANLQTAGGSTHVAGGRAGQVSLGSATLTDQEFLFTNIEYMHALSPEIQGVLGEEFLSHFDYTIDFASRRFAFTEAPPEGLRIPLRLSNGRPAIPTSEGDLVLDSGTDAAILRRSASGRVEMIHTAAGLSVVKTIRHLPIKIAGREYRPTWTAFAPKGLIEEDGLLPACLFRALYVSNSGKYVVLNPVF